MATMIDFSEPADRVAPQLLGAILRRGGVTIRLTEVEAYLGTADPASHAHKGPTPRCRTMFGAPGHLYVYASYGIHRAGNLVCSPDGTASGCLMRGGEVIEGIDIVRARRGPTAPDAGLARGPGNLGAALGLTLSDDATPVHSVSGRDPEAERQREAHPDTDLWIQEAPGPVEMVRGRRIGISKNADAPLRYWIPGDPTVSSPRSLRVALEVL
ncbi:DNA-3-methyladenine glycosylase [Curtobacterium sp. S6]|uniref:DNA-3-methyladenine glycosylase n=1 Tax=Curtobacterium sp. S6 TaxID=1479623 RepID=UPI00056459D0|nr:DNA-3-methyladenine glycosylase [Curtobacterium sp. S6]